MGLVCPNCQHEIVRDREQTLALRLTRQQRACLDVLVSFAAREKRGARYADIAAGMGIGGPSLKSKISRYLGALRRLGLVTPKDYTMGKIAPTAKAWELYGDPARSSSEAVARGTEDRAP